MKAIIDIPDNFIKNKRLDDIVDSLQRIRTDIKFNAKRTNFLLTGEYDIETLDMLCVKLEESGEILESDTASIARKASRFLEGQAYKCVKSLLINTHQPKDKKVYVFEILNQTYGGLIGSIGYEYILARNKEEKESIEKMIIHYGNSINRVFEVSLNKLESMSQYFVEEEKETNNEGS